MPLKLCHSLPRFHTKKKNHLPLPQVCVRRTVKPGFGEPSIKRALTPIPKLASVIFLYKRAPVQRTPLVADDATKISFI